MADLGEILRGVGRGIGTAGRVAGQGLGVALTPVAMAMAARSGRNPLSAMPGYQEALDPLQQARLQEALSQADVNRAFIAGLPGMGGGGQQAASSGIGGEAPYYLAAPGMPTAPATTPQPGLLGSVLGSIAESAQSMPRHAMPAQPAPQGQVVQRQPGRAPMQLGSVSVSGGRVSGQYKVPEPFRVKAGTINPVTNKPYVPGDFESGRPVIVEPSTERAKAAIDVANQRIRSTGAKGFLSALRKSVEALPFAEDGADLVFAGPMLYKMAYWDGDKDAVNLQTAAGRLPVLVEALQRDGRVSDQDVTLLRQNLPSFFDVKSRALSKIQNIEDLLNSRNINLDEELARLDAEAGAPVNPGAGSAPSPVARQPRQPRTLAPSPRAGFREQFSSAAGVVARAKGGPVAPMQTALVGERGPELLTTPEASYVTPLAEVQQAQANRIGRAQNAGMPMQLAQANTPDAKRGSMYTGGTPTTTIPPSGIRQGVGMAPADVEKAKQGGTVVWDPVLGRAVTVY